MKANRNLKLFGMFVLEMIAAAVFLFVLASPSRSANPAGPATYPTAEAAGQALFTASQSGSEAALLQVLGPDAAEIISTGDRDDDAAARSNFAAKYQEMHRFKKMTDGSLQLVVGAENWPLPIPLKSKDGAWYFDVPAGKNEVLYRRLGKNELAAIFASGELVEAQKQYFVKSGAGEAGQYAQKLASDPGERNGLSYAENGNAAAGSIDPIIANADATKSSDRNPFHGYYFRVLTQQGPAANGGAKNYIANGKMTGGFAFVAYPAEYRSSGVMTFIVSDAGVVYEKDLAADTAKIAASMKSFDPDSTWSRVD
jgi:hypothetical protein